MAMLVSSIINTNSKTSLIYGNPKVKSMSLVSKTFSNSDKGVSPDSGDKMNKNGIDHLKYPREYDTKKDDPSIAKLNTKKRDKVFVLTADERFIKDAEYDINEQAKLFDFLKKRRRKSYSFILKQENENRYREDQI